MFATLGLERGYLHITLFAPVFAVLVALAVQAEMLAMDIRDLTMICMASTSAWCVFVRGLPQFSHLSLFATGMIFSGLAFGLHRHDLADYAAVLLVAPQALLLGVSLQGIADERERA